jgi:hypothetical protein
MMNINIYNASGNLIRNLVNNRYLGAEGSVNWDGLTNDDRKAPIGIYVFYIEVFDLQGNVNKYKRTGVLAGRL